ncbi:MAG: hypothetical protein KAI79_07340 [Bacteroidales bacterium]|nr:hypothetical protein [Bacteroidales bacterium]
MSIEDIEKEVANGNKLFHSKIEQDMFNDALFLYSHSKYIGSASVAFVLYEKMFATKLIRETSYPNNFVANEQNMKEQIDHLMKREKEVVDGKSDNKKGLGFSDITMQLFNKELISQQEMDEYNLFYKEYRNPVLHGLSYRLFEKMYDKKPSLPFDPDMVAEKMYKTISEYVVEKIFGIAYGGKFLKK